MKLLFVQGGTRLKRDYEGRWYTDGNFDDNVWKRYTDLCDRLMVLLRQEVKVYDREEAQKRFNSFNTENIELVPLEDIYTPLYEIADFAKRKKLYARIENAVSKCDKVIIRSLTNFYTAAAYKACKKLDKPYALEVTGIGWDSTWYHGLTGKPIAFYVEARLKRAVFNSSYTLYVTQTELQKRYPCKGKSIGCSNVELQRIDDNDLKQRLRKIKSSTEKIVIGTIGNYTLRTKGQFLVIKALSILKKRGKTNIEYQLVGSGSMGRLEKLAHKLDVADHVQFLGSMSHEKVFEWLEMIDVYIQPSYQEGLCRSVVEAMSKACPVICSDACGERELAGDRFIFKRGHVYELAKALETMISSKTIMESEAMRSFEKSKEYQKNILDNRRYNFYMEFMKS